MPEIVAENTLAELLRSSVSATLLEAVDLELAQDLGSGRASYSKQSHSKSNTSTGYASNSSAPKLGLDESVVRELALRLGSVR